MLTLILVVLAALAMFAGSALLHPYTACETCQGKGRHVGGLFKQNYRPCHKCSGTGQKQRLAAYLLGIGRERKSSSKKQPSTSSLKRKEKKEKS